MAIPIITATQTVLAWAVGQEFSFQFAASNTPTLWKIKTGSFLPSGVLLDTATGKLYGAGMVPGVWSVEFVASNALGDSDPVLFAIAIFDLPAGNDVSKLATVNTDTWEVAFEDAFTEIQGGLGAAAGGVRYGDIVTFALKFTDGSGVSAAEVFPKLVEARLSVKGLDTEPVFFVTPTWDFKTAVVFDGVGYGRKYFVNASFVNEALLSFLNDYEADGGTAANCLCEFEFVIKRPPAAGAGDINLITTRPFTLRVQRDTIK